MKSDDVLTTGEAAKVCCLSIQTVIRSIEQGLISGHKVPGSRFRRVSRLEVRRFIKKFGLPRHGLSPEERCVVMVSKDPTKLAREIPLAVPGCSVKYVNTFEAGMIVAECRASVVIIDDRLGAPCLEMLTANLSSLDLPVPFIVLTNTTESIQGDVHQVPRGLAVQTLPRTIESLVH